jgi:hypothetical protein
LVGEGVEVGTRVSPRGSFKQIKSRHFVGCQGMEISEKKVVVSTDSKKKTRQLNRQSQLHNILGNDDLKVL